MNRSRMWVLTPLAALGAHVACLWMFCAPAEGAGYQGVDLYTMTTSAPVGFGLQTFPTTANPQVQTAAGGQLAGYTGTGHAMLWTAPTGVGIDLHPTNLSGFSGSRLWGTNGSQQVGFASGAERHAMLWNGTSNSAVDLNPTNLSSVTGTTATATDGVHQVGFGSANFGTTHALLWSGTGASAVDLHPSGFDSSVAIGTSGSHQVGSGLPAGSLNSHALMWSGTASSAIDLNPAGATVSMAYGVFGNQQVGSAGSQTLLHAALWNSTASAIDLNPSGFGYSEALGTNGVSQVGYGYPNDGSPFGERHALAWTGTANSYVDLDLLLPDGFHNTSGGFHTSYAYSIDAQGDIFGFAIDDNADFHAVKWVSVPEPAALMVVTAAASFAVMCRRRG